MICLLAVVVLADSVNCSTPEVIKMQKQPPQQAIQVREIVLYFVFVWPHKREGKADSFDVLYVDGDNNYYLWNIPHVEHIETVKRMLITR